MIHKLREVAMQATLSIIANETALNEIKIRHF
jgi:hypothetical protein